MLCCFIANPSKSEQTGFSFPASNCITNMLKRFIDIIMMVVAGVITRSITLVCYSIYRVDNSIADDILYPVFVKNARLFLTKQALHFCLNAYRSAPIYLLLSDRISIDQWRYVNLILIQRSRCIDTGQ